MNQRGKISPALRRFFAYLTWIAMRNIKPKNRFYRSADFLKYSRSKKRFPVILFFNAENFSLPIHLILSPTAKKTVAFNHFQYR